MDYTRVVILLAQAAPAEKSGTTHKKIEKNCKIYETREISVEEKGKEQRTLEKTKQTIGVLIWIHPHMYILIRNATV